MSEPAAKKVRGEGHWLPAVTGASGPVPIEWTRHLSPKLAKDRAREILKERAAPPDGT